MGLIAIDMVFALAIAALVTMVFVFAAWAGGVWLTPVGPALWGVYWLPFVVIALVAGAIFAAAVSGSADRRDDERGDFTTGRGGPVWLAALYSVVVVLLVIAIFAKYAI